MVGLAQIRKRHAAACSSVGIQNMFHSAPQHDGGGHVEIVEGQYHYVFTERGFENERRITHSEDDILYWLASTAVFSAAVDFEVKSRVPKQDFRRVLFAKEIDLLHSMDPQWADRKRSEIASILEEHPYDDSLGWP